MHVFPEDQSWCSHCLLSSGCSVQWMLVNSLPWLSRNSVLVLTVVVWAGWTCIINRWMWSCLCKLVLLPRSSAQARIDRLSSKKVSLFWFQRLKLHVLLSLPSKNKPMARLGLRWCSLLTPPSALDAFPENWENDPSETGHPAMMLISCLLICLFEKGYHCIMQAALKSWAQVITCLSLPAAVTMYHCVWLDYVSHCIEICVELDPRAGTVLGYCTLLNDSLSPYRSSSK